MCELMRACVYLMILINGERICIVALILAREMNAIQLVGSFFLALLLKRCAA